MTTTTLAVLGVAGLLIGIAIGNVWLAIFGIILLIAAAFRG